MSYFERYRTEGIVPNLSECIEIVQEAPPTPSDATPFEAMFYAQAIYYSGLFAKAVPWLRRAIENEDDCNTYELYDELVTFKPELPTLLRTGTDAEIKSTLLEAYRKGMEGGKLFAHKTVAPTDAAMYIKMRIKEHIRKTAGESVPRITVLVHKFLYWSREIWKIISPEAPNFIDIPPQHYPNGPFFPALKSTFECTDDESVIKKVRRSCPLRAMAMETLLQAAFPSFSDGRTLGIFADKVIDLSHEEKTWRETADKEEMPSSSPSAATRFLADGITFEELFDSYASKDGTTSGTKHTRDEVEEEEDDSTVPHAAIKRATTAGAGSVEGDADC